MSKLPASLVIHRQMSPDATVTLQVRILCAKFTPNKFNNF